ncbi:MAG TPA: hypothetical protein VHU41_19760 [Thermoanaerobaculia bacterium]|nr:hypothetical protein [Thermoanaerobaculia bacterium]
MKKSTIAALSLILTLALPALAQPSRDGDNLLDRVIKKVVRLVHTIAHPLDDYPTPPKP